MTLKHIADYTELELFDNTLRIGFISVVLATGLSTLRYLEIWTQ